MPAAITPSLPAHRPCVVVMGVAGCGKSTVGKGLAEALDLPFVEGDAFHPPENIAKMSTGRPLDDADRAGWLQALAGRLHEACVRNEGAVLACSALKRRYRDILRSGAPGLRFVLLHGDRSLIAVRLQARPGHFMPPGLLDSQVRDLEIPDADEACLICDPVHPSAQLVDRVVTWLSS